MDFAADKKTWETKSEDVPDFIGKGRAISWEASEYVHHDKGVTWLIGLILVALAGIGAAAWFGQWMFAFLLAVMAIAFGYYAMRKPRTIHYELSDDELKINSTTYPLETFRAFGVVADGALFTIKLISAKRFAPAIMIYFAEEDGEEIVDLLGAHIPMEQMEPDLLDALMRKLRF